MSVYPNYQFNNPIYRGELFIADLDGMGHEIHGVRPVVVIQNDTGNKHSPTIIIAPVTSSEAVFKRNIPTNMIIDKDKYGLEYEHQVILLNQIKTIDKTRLHKKIAKLDTDDLKRLDDFIGLSLGMTQNQEGKGMKQLQKVFDYEGKQVRTFLIENEPWFAAVDVCDSLGLSNVTESLKALEEDEKTTLRISEGGPERRLINEPGLYNLVIRSNKPEAKAFKRWITHDVIPQIRKTGSYSVQPQSIEDLIIMQAQSMKDLKTKVNQLEDSQKTIKETIIYRPDNWRDSINKMFDRVARANDNRFRDMRAESYRILEERSGCDLEKRLDNLKDRKREAGATTTEIKRTNKIEVIEADQKLREIYTAIIKELVIKYVA